MRGTKVSDVTDSRQPRGSHTGFFAGAPDLAIEVLSPSGTRDPAARARATAKIADWLAAGCLEVWCVDPASRTATVHTASGVATIARESDSIASQAVQGLAVGLADLLPAST